MARRKVSKKELTFEITDNLGCMDNFVYPEEIEIISSFAGKILSHLTSLSLDDRIGQERPLDSDRNFKGAKPYRDKK